MSPNFAITGVSGYVAPRHLKAIKDTGNTLWAAIDPHDAAGVIDSYFEDVPFFTEFERFDRHIEMLRRLKPEEHIDWVTICSPNHLHDAHCRFALRVGANALCEKPLVLNPWNLDALAELESDFNKRIYTVLQLRVHPAVLELKQKLAAAQAENKKNNNPEKKKDIRLTYVTGRGPWYQVSWKGQAERSGGLTTNIGIHFFDLLIWLFGGVKKSQVHLNQTTRSAGFLELDNARVQWFLSIDTDDLPDDCKAQGQRTFRSLTMDGEEFEFSGGFADLHTEVYRNILSGQGYGIEDSRASIELVHNIRSSKATDERGDAHPFVK